MQKAKKQAHQLPLLTRIQNRAEKIYLPGFKGVSLYTVISFLIREIRENKLNVRGAAVTYNFLMAIPPTLLFLCTLIPYLPGVEKMEKSLLEIIHIVSPTGAYEPLEALINDLVHKEQKGLLSIGIIMALFFSSNGVMGLMRAFDRNSSLHIKRNGLKRRITAIKLTIMLLLVALATLVMLVLQTSILNHYLEQLPGGSLGIKLLSMLIVVFLLFISISMVYRYGPSFTHKIPFISPGSVLATIGCIVLTIVFFSMVNNVIQYNKVYGSIGSLIGFMAWIFLNTQVILFGFELNVSILLGKHELKK